MKFYQKLLASAAATIALTFSAAGYASEAYCPAVVACPDSNYSNCQVDDGWSLPSAKSESFQVHAGVYRLFMAGYLSSSDYAMCFYSYEGQIGGGASSAMPPLSIFFLIKAGSLFPDTLSSNWQKKGGDFMCDNGTNPISPVYCPFEDDDFF